MDHEKKTKKPSKIKKNEEKKKKMSEAKSNIENIFSNIKVKGKDKGGDVRRNINEEGKIQKKNLQKKSRTTAKMRRKEENVKMKKNGDERLRTPDGLPIYSVEELKMGKGGYTKECPFDCNCCF
ncbi:conserved protein, unknown function [Plasmodium ovale]|uniref:DUF1764 domain-containing protein n=2 Tax=Plasmodium ovale TaxID=36330 RepID=A0A1A8VXH2_PLAOA|nr:conserved protein, unknown function [Plasmodium ovale curtisi]SCP04519.1 conserved protein, unknown function [Plasmodium ovale]